MAEGTRAVQAAKSADLRVTAVRDKLCKNKDRYAVMDGDNQIGSLYLPKGTPLTTVQVSIVCPS